MTTSARRRRDLAPIFGLREAGAMLLAVEQLGDDLAELEAARLERRSGRPGFACDVCGATFDDGITAGHHRHAAVSVAAI